jgi:hypothetical protein
MINAQDVLAERRDSPGRSCSASCAGSKGAAGTNGRLQRLDLNREWLDEAGRTLMRR